VLKLDVGLLIDNQSKRVVVVRGLKAQVLFGDEEAGKISVTKKIRIVAEAEEEYRVPVEIELQDLGKLSRALFYPSANGKKKAFHLRGVLKIRSGILCKRIPFDEKKVVRMF
jgi:LEA14-like dessication related protein